MGKAMFCHSFIDIAHICQKLGENSFYPISFILYAPYADVYMFKYRSFLDPILPLMLMFVYLCTGAFLIPYALMLIFVGIPTFFMELIMGQYSGYGPLHVWAFAPLFYGVYLQKPHLNEQ